MPAWRRTKLLPGLYDEPVSEHLQQEVAGFGSAAQLHANQPKPSPPRRRGPRLPEP
jgi:hypothetical protein